MAESDSGSMPSRASRLAVSFTPNPQSIITRVAPHSATSPLPSLPLPIDAKRIIGGSRRDVASRDLSAFDSIRVGRATRGSLLLELVLQERQDALARLGLVGAAVRVLHAHDTLLLRLGDLDPVVLDLFLVVLLPEHELLDPAIFLVLLRHLRIGIGVADEVHAVRAVAVDDGEPRAIEREAHTAPRAVERIVDQELRAAVTGLLETRAIGRGR